MSTMMSMVGELVVMAVGGSALIGANARSRRIIALIATMLNA